MKDFSCLARLSARLSQLRAGRIGAELASQLDPVIMRAALFCSFSSFTDTAPDSAARNAWHNDLPFCVPKIPGGTSRKLGKGCAARFLKPLPYFRAKSVIFATLFET